MGLLYQCTRLLPFAATSLRPGLYNRKRKAIWTGVRGGLQNRSAAVKVAGVFDSHCLPPTALPLTVRLLTINPRKPEPTILLATSVYIL